MLFKKAESYKEIQKEIQENKDEKETEIFRLGFEVKLFWYFMLKLMSK